MSKVQTRRSVSISRSVYERLTAFAAAQGTSGSQIVESALARILPPPAKKLALTPPPPDDTRTATCAPDPEATPAEAMAIAWWNELADEQRLAIMVAATDVLGEVGGAPSTAEVWNLRVGGELAGPELPPGATMIDIAALQARERAAQRSPAARESSEMGPHTLAPSTPIATPSSTLVPARASFSIGHRLAGELAEVEAAP